MDMMALRRKIIEASKRGLLPAGYQQIDYIQCSGTQYIATDYVAPSSVSVEWDYYITDTSVGDRMMWGSRGSGTKDRCYAELYNNKWYCSNSDVVYYGVLSNVGNTTGTKYHAKMDSSALVVDGSSASPTGTDYTAPPVPIYIFAWNQNGVLQYIHNRLRLYSLKFTSNGSPSANFVPCIRNSDSEPGMYDTVAGKFYANAGTGTFIIPS